MSKSTFYSLGFQDGKAFAAKVMEFGLDPVAAILPDESKQYARGWNDGIRKAVEEYEEEE